jgi:hypothetical protein
MGNSRLLYFRAVHRQKPSLKIDDQASDLGGRYWDRTSDLFGVKRYVRSIQSAEGHPEMLGYAYNPR